MRIWKAIVAGQLLVNVPAACLMLTVMFLGSSMVPWPFALLGGSLIAWGWWAYTVPRWRDWAIGRGNDPDRLRTFAVRTGLTWPRSSPFERTQSHRKQ